jgi:hypothetical protein
MPPTPSAVQSSEGTIEGSRSTCRVAASTAATGMGHGAATAEPHPTRMPVETESGTCIPSGSPGTFSRIATTLLYVVAPANPIAAARRARFLVPVTDADFRRTSTSLEGHAFADPCAPQSLYDPSATDFTRSRVRSMSRWLRRSRRNPPSGRQILVKMLSPRSNDSVTSVPPSSVARNS